MSDVEPTINGVGGEGFAVDGTDSFAIDLDAPSDEAGGGPPPGSRRGLYMTVATGLALLLIVVIAGSAGSDGQSSLRGGAVRSTEDDAVTATTDSTETTEPDDDQSSASESSGRSGDEARSPMEAEYDDDTMYNDEYVDFSLDDFDLDEYDDFTDDESSSGDYLPRRVPYVPSTRRTNSTVPPWYRLPTTTTTTTTTVPEEEPTTTTLAETTTTVDTTPPGAPVITGPASITNDLTPGFVGTGEGGSTVTVSEGTSALCTAGVAGGAWSCESALALADGPHSFTAAAVDAAGNSATGPTVIVTIDTRAPTAPVISAPANGSGTPDTTPTFIGIGEDGSTVTLSGGASSCTSTVSGGAWSCTPTLTAGAHTLTPTAVDAAGNSTPGAPVQVTVDPAAPAITSPADGSGTPGTTPTFSGTGTAPSTVTVSAGTTNLCTDLVSPQGTWSCVSTVLAQGTHVVTTRAGTVPGASIRLTIDDAAPVITSSTVTNTTVVFAGTGQTGSTVTVFEGAITTCTDVVALGAWSCTSAALPIGTHTFTTSADVAGSSVPGATVTVTIA